MQTDFYMLFQFFRGTKQQAEINLCLQAITYVAMNFHWDHTYKLQQSRAFYCVRYSMISVRF